MNEIKSPNRFFLTVPYTIAKSEKKTQNIAVYIVTLLYYGIHPTLLGLISSSKS